jgi:hypothetical protein
MGAEGFGDFADDEAALGGGDEAPFLEGGLGAGDGFFVIGGGGQGEGG